MLLQIEEGGDELGAIGPPPSQRNCWLPARLREGSAAGGWEARQEVASLEAEAMLGCDGDLAEADQSHEDGRAAESSMVVGAPTSTSDSLGDGPISGRNSQAEGIAADDSSSDLAEVSLYCTLVCASSLNCFFQKINNSVSVILLLKFLV